MNESEKEERMSDLVSIKAEAALANFLAEHPALWEAERRAVMSALEVIRGYAK